MTQPPVGFLCYARFDDEYENGRLSALRQRLSAEVRFQTGNQEFDIFQDQLHIAWGENWQQRLIQSLANATFLLPIITPSFFKSDYCREELEKFLARERDLGRSDLILPIYYLDYPPLNSRRPTDDPLVQAVKERQWFDWRELRFEDLNNLPIRRMLAEMGKQIARAMERVQSASTPLPDLPVEVQSPTPVSPMPVFNLAALKQLRRKAVVAFFTQDWEQAELLLSQLAEADPTDEDVQTKLEEARRQQHRQQQYRQIRGLRDAGHWQAVLNALAELERQYPTSSDPDRHRVWAEAQQQRDELYDTALEAFEREDWASVSESLHALLREFPNDEAAQGLLTTVRKRREAAEQEHWLAEQLQQARQAQADNDLRVAEKRLKDILTQVPSHAEATHLLESIQAKIAQRDAHFSEAQNAFDRGDLENARTILEHLLVTYPGGKGGQALLHKVIARQRYEQQYADALHAYERHDWRTTISILTKLLEENTIDEQSAILLKQARDQQNAEQRAEQARQRQEVSKEEPQTVSRKRRIFWLSLTVVGVLGAAVLLAFLFLGESVPETVQEATSTSNQQQVAAETPETADTVSPMTPGTQEPTIQQQVTVETPETADTMSLITPGTQEPTEAIPDLADFSAVDPAIIASGTVLESNGWQYIFAQPTFATPLTGNLGSFQPDGRFVVVLALVKNNIGQSQSVPQDFFVLKDAQDRVYEARPELSTAYIDQFGRGIAADLSQEDQVPSDGLRRSVPIVFDVETDATDLVFFARSNPSEGWLVLEDVDTDDISAADPAIIAPGTILESNGWQYVFARSTFATPVIGNLGDFQPDGRFIAVLVIIKNNTGQPQKLPQNFFILKDAQDRVYEARPELSTAYIDQFGRGIAADLSQEDEIPADELQRSMVIVFDVETDATDLVLFARSNPSEGWLVLEDV